MRELREELGVETEPLERIPGEWPLAPGYVLRVWTARLVSGVPAPLQDHDELRWLGPGESDAVDWLDQDRPAVAEAMRRLPTGTASDRDTPTGPLSDGARPRRAPPPCAHAALPYVPHVDSSDTPPQISGMG